MMKFCNSNERYGRFAGKKTRRKKLVALCFSRMLCYVTGSMTLCAQHFLLINFNFKRKQRALMPLRKVLKFHGPLLVFIPFIFRLPCHAINPSELWPLYYASGYLFLLYRCFDLLQEEKKGEKRKKKNPQLIILDLKKST